MPLKLMYITNRPDVALIAEKAGVDRIFIDMEYIGKGLRQGGMDSVQNHHTVEDVRTIRSVLTKAELLVRVNPIHEATDDYCSSEEEIEQVIAAGADIVMLPFFKTADEVRRFVTCVNGRVRTLLLLETPEAAAHVDEIIAVPGIDEIHIGINDLSLGYGKSFMFELLADGTVEKLCLKFKKAGIPYGFGGIAALGKGLIPAEMVIKEHYRLGSSMTILSRSFFNVDKISGIEELEVFFSKGVKEIRALEEECALNMVDYNENKYELKKAVRRVLDSRRIKDS